MASEHSEQPLGEPKDWQAGSSQSIKPLPSLSMPSAQRRALFSWALSPWSITVNIAVFKSLVCVIFISFTLVKSHLE